MSAESFRALFNNPAFSYFYKQEISGKPTDRTSILGIGRQESKAFVKKTVGDFILSKEQLTDIFGSSSAAKILSAAKTDLNFSDIVVYRSIAGQEQIVLPDIKFDTTNKSVSKILNDIGKSVGENNVIGKIESYFDKNPQDIGHIFGFANTLLTRTKEAARKKILISAEESLAGAKNIGDPSGISEAETFLKSTLVELKALDSFIDSMVDVLEEYDMASSPIKGLDLPVNAKYRKTAENWAFTWESRAAQQKEGSKLATVLGTINQGKIGGKGVRGLFATLALKPSDDVVKKVLESFVQEFVDKGISSPNSSSLNLLQQRSSPRFIDLIEANLKEALGVKNPYKKEYTGNVALKSIPLARIKKPSGIKKSIADTKGAKAKIAKVKDNTKKQLLKLKNISISDGTRSLISLQNLINRQLQDVISANMGDGDSRSVLNYRTGRLASSAKVETMSQSRAGMITAFYTYMKNPYATFSEGGKQQNPKSRDPKLLIAKSIREIAQQQVGNRLRAVTI
jgi:hypothetical protein